MWCLGVLLRVVLGVVQWSVQGWYYMDINKGDVRGGTGVGTVGGTGVN